MLRPMTIFTTNLENERARKVVARRSAVENDIPAPEAKSRKIVYVNIAGAVMPIEV